MRRKERGWRRWVRYGGGLLLAGLAGWGVLWILAWWLRPANLGEEPAKVDPEIALAAEIARQALFDPNNTPSLHRHIYVKPKGQSPILEELVREGKLPPLEERMPEEPTVMEGPDGIGKYGGTWMRIAISEGDVGIITYRLSGPYLVRWSPLGYPIEPHIAKSVEPSEDYRVWTVKLRKGLKWSDGHPYTADDIMYWWECEANNPYISNALPDWMMIGGEAGRVEKVDEYCVRFVFPKPNPLFLEKLAGQTIVCNTPAHYLRPYHPDPAIGDAKLIQEKMRAYRLASPQALYGFIKDHMNPEHPRLWPWICRTYKSTPPYVFVRNPYYYVVDPAGNQLPYIDRLQFDIQDSKLLAVSVANGRASMQDRHVRFKDYTELMSRRKVAGTRVLHWYSASRSVYTVNPNLNKQVPDPNDTAGRWKARLLADKRFRQALSLAIDRRRIIEAEYNGVGEPSQVAPGPLSRFANEKVAKAYTEYDPERANRLLDELGLTKRDYEGYRTFPDGTRMTFFLDFTDFTGIGPAQFMVEDWKKVGVRVIPRERSRPLFYVEKDGMLFDLNVWTGESDLFPLLHPRYFVPHNTECFYAVGWGKWYMRGGYYGLPASKSPGCIPVPRDHPMYEAITYYEQALQATSFEEQKRLMDKVFEIAAENVWSINIATAPPQPVVVKEGFKNVPENALYGVIFATPANAGIETYFFENPQDSPGAIAETKQSLERIVPKPVLSGPSNQPRDQGAGAVLRRVIQGLVLVGVVAAVVMLVMRHPWVGRRLLIMIPQFLVISVVVFTTIQLPPGDFLATRIIQLQQSGDPTDLKAIEDLKKMFHYDEPVVMRYLRWMGFRWFFTFRAEDRGLLQGDLGRSMETTQPVNAMVGDRLLLTIALSAGTILFTWVTAIPIGIYSAVRQYHISDYVLTILGFIGMSMPAFLLALILMAATGVEGLFSPEYATQPEWTWGKVVDLMKHIWVPVVVLGVGGTAGMIRVMRANLLDELRKPYVTTARAKGVRPIKLLLKYPVRIAINPFISGIGALFPQLVSGGAIVSMVLALPTIGPMLLSALLTEDMYLAGSMLVLLSMLGVVGTLVSDLLLLWLDPRIRFEGGTR